MLNVPWMVAPTNIFGAQQREIMISRKSGAFVPLKVSASAEISEREVIFARVQRYCCFEEVSADRSGF